MKRIESNQILQGQKKPNIKYMFFLYSMGIEIYNLCLVCSVKSNLQHCKDQDKNGVFVHIRINIPP